MMNPSANTSSNHDLAPSMRVLHFGKVLKKSCESTSTPYHERWCVGTYGVFSYFSSAAKAKRWLISHIHFRSSTFSTESYCTRISIWSNLHCIGWISHLTGIWWWWYWLFRFLDSLPWSASSVQLTTKEQHRVKCRLCLSLHSDCNAMKNTFVSNRKHSKSASRKNSREVI